MGNIAVSYGTPPPTDAATEALVAGLSEEAIRNMAEQAEKNGTESVATAITPAPIVEQPVTQVITPEPAAQPATEIPAKFKKPDGTLDEEKLQTSSKQLDEAIEKKQKTVDEMLAEYRAKEKAFHEKSKEASEIQKQAPQVPQAEIQPAQVPSSEFMRQQIQQDIQRDPVGTIVELARIVALKETEPLQQLARKLEEKEQDSRIRSNIADLASKDSRVLDPQYFAAINEEIASDPGYTRLKNPHKAAWNEVKERLRLGEPSPALAQPSKPSSPMLGGGGIPPSVPSAAGNATPESLFSAIDQAKSPDELAKLEQALRTLLQRVRF